MAQTTTSAIQQQVNMPAIDLRQAIGQTVVLEGVRSTVDFLVQQRAAGANMSVDIPAGSAVIQDDHTGGGGFYPYTLATTANVPITGADATNPRVDTVVLRVRDQALGDAANDAAPFVVAGTPTAGATLTNLNGIGSPPGSSLLIAYVLVPAASSSVTNANIDNVGVGFGSVRAVRPLMNERRAEFTANVTTTVTTAATASTIVTAPQIFLDGATTVNVWFYSPFLAHSVAGTAAIVNLWDATDLGTIAQVTAPSAGGGASVCVSRRLTPSNGNHTFTARLWGAAAGTATAVGGAGGPGVVMPGYIAVTEV